LLIGETAEGMQQKLLEMQKERKLKAFLMSEENAGWLNKAKEQ